MAEKYQQDSNTLFGYFSSERNAEAALRELHTAGFTRNEVRVACHREPAISVKKPEPGFWHRTQAFLGGGANPEPVRTGTVQPLSTGQTAGPESTGRYDLDAGDFHRTLTGLKLPDEHSRYFSERFDREKEAVLVTVDAGGRRSEAETILRNNGADLGDGVQSHLDRQRATNRLKKAS